LDNKLRNKKPENSKSKKQQQKQSEKNRKESVPYAPRSPIMDVNLSDDE